MNKWQAWWDKANEVIDAAPNGVEYYWLAARPTDVVPEVKLFCLNKSLPVKSRLSDIGSLLKRMPTSPPLVKRVAKPWGQEKQDASGRIMLSMDVFRLRSLEGETV